LPPLEAFVWKHLNPLAMPLGALMAVAPPATTAEPHATAQVMLDSAVAVVAKMSPTLLVAITERRLAHVAALDQAGAYLGICHGRNAVCDYDVLCLFRRFGALYSTRRADPRVSALVRDQGTYKPNVFNSVLPLG